MNLTLEKEYNFLSTLETIEYVNYDLLNRILNSDKLRSGQFYAGDYFYTNEKQQLERYIKTLSKKTNLKKVDYKMSKGNTFGRVYPQFGLSVGQFSKNIRHTVCIENYIDIDMVNAHPTILLQICIKNNIKCEQLKYYVDNREAIFKKGNPTNDKGIKTHLKELIISCMFGSKYEKQHQVSVVEVDDQRTRRYRWY